MENTATVVFPFTPEPDIFRAFRLFRARFRLRCGKSRTRRQRVQIVMERSVTALQQAASKPDMIHAGANLVNGVRHGTLVLDRLGRILSCGAPAEEIFGASQVRLVGRWISEFIGGLFLAGSSPSYNTRYLIYLCAEGEWRKYEAMDADGQGFEVELNLSRIMTDGQEMLLLNLRRSEGDHIQPLAA